MDTGAGAFLGVIMEGLGGFINTVNDITSLHCTTPSCHIILYDIVTHNNMKDKNEDIEHRLSHSDSV